MSIFSSSENYLPGIRSLHSRELPSSELPPTMWSSLYISKAGQGAGLYSELAQWKHMGLLCKEEPSPTTKVPKQSRLPRMWVFHKRHPILQEAVSSEGRREGTTIWTANFQELWSSTVSFLVVDLDFLQSLGQDLISGASVIQSMEFAVGLHHESFCHIFPGCACLFVAQLDSELTACFLMAIPKI